MTTTFQPKMMMKTALALAAFATLAACTTKDERSDIVITRIIPAKLSGSGASATCLVQPTDLENSLVTVDLNLTDSLVRGVVVDNRLSSNANGAQNRLNTNDFEVQNERVRLTFPDPAYPGTTIERLVPISGVFPVSSATAIGATLFTPEMGAALRAIALPATGRGTIRLAIRFEGNLLDGSGVQTTEREFVVQICKGCLDTSACPTGAARNRSCTPGTSDDTNTCP